MKELWMQTPYRTVREAQGEEQQNEPYSFVLGQTLVFSQKPLLSSLQRWGHHYHVFKS